MNSHKSYGAALSSGVVIVHINLVLAFESVDEIVHSNNRYKVVLSSGTEVCCIRWF